MEERREGEKVGNKKGNKKNGRSQGTVQVVNKGGKGRTSRLLLGKNCKKSKLLNIQEQKIWRPKKATFAGSLFNPHADDVAQFVGVLRLCTLLVGTRVFLTVGRASVKKKKVHT
jgi:hypothetical protein